MRTTPLRRQPARSAPFALVVLSALGLATGLLLPNCAAAQASAPGNAVYRCPDGQYRQTPCVGGRVISVNSGPSAQQQAEAQAQATRESQLAEQLRRERQARERGVAGLAGIGPSAAAASVSSRGSTAGGKASARDKDDSSTTPAESGQRSRVRPQLPT